MRCCSGKYNAGRDCSLQGTRRPNVGPAYRTSWPENASAGGLHILHRVDQDLQFRHAELPVLHVIHALPPDLPGLRGKALPVQKGHVATVLLLYFISYHNPTNLSITYSSKVEDVSVVSRIITVEFYSAYCIIKFGLLYAKKLAFCASSTTPAWLVPAKKPVSSVDQQVQ